MSAPCPTCLDFKQSRYAQIIGRPSGEADRARCTCKPHKIGCHRCADYEDCFCDDGCEERSRLDDGSPCCGYLDACDACLRRLASITLDGPPRTPEELRIAMRLAPLLTKLEDDS